MLLACFTENPSRVVWDGMMRGLGPGGSSFGCACSVARCNYDSTPVLLMFRPLSVDCSGWVDTFSVRWQRGYEANSGKSGKR